MGWKKTFRKIGKLKLGMLTGGLSYAAEKTMDAQKEAAEAAAEEQRRANAEMERLQKLQAGATPTEMATAGNTALDEVNKKSALRRSILSRSQNASGKLGA